MMILNLIIFKTLFGNNSSKIFSDEHLYYLPSESKNWAHGESIFNAFQLFQRQWKKLRSLQDSSNRKKGLKLTEQQIALSRIKTITKNEANFLLSEMYL